MWCVLLVSVQALWVMSVKDIALDPIHIDGVHHPRLGPSTWSPDYYILRVNDYRSPNITGPSYNQTSVEIQVPSSLLDPLIEIEYHCTSRESGSDGRCHSQLNVLRSSHLSSPTRRR